MPELRLQGRGASPIRFAFIMISLPENASKTSITCPPASGGVATSAREKLGFEEHFREAGATKATSILQSCRCLPQARGCGD